MTGAIIKFGQVTMYKEGMLSIWPKKVREILQEITPKLNYAAAAKLLQSYLTVQPHRQQPARLPIPGILQARTLEWVAISFSNARK